MGKILVVGILDRFTHRVATGVVGRVDRKKLHAFVLAPVRPEARVYTDKHAGYRSLPEMNRQTVRHSIGDYVRGNASTNRIESFRALPKRGVTGVNRRFRPQHLPRYMVEFVWRHNHRPQRVIERMCVVVSGMVGKRLRLRDLMGRRRLRLRHG